MRRGEHPVNLAVRFLLEVAAAVGIFRLGLHLADGVVAGLLAVTLMAVGVTAWGTCNVPGDASRSGSAPVPVPGPVRLGIELTVFTSGAAGWFIAGPRWFALTYLVATVVHHLASVDRLTWLMRAGADGVAR
jgi:hypothetical protein